jgi:Domain of unknown function (DUF1707)
MDRKVTGWSAQGQLCCAFVHRGPREVPVIAGPGDEMSAGGGRGHLRASHADRERLIGVLKSAFVQGMLAKDEFDLRVGQTLASRTYGELAALTADLPPGLAAARPAQGRRPVIRPGRVIAVATALYGGAWAYVLFLSPHGGDNSWAAVLLLQGFLVYLGVLLICVGAILVSRQDRRSGRQRPRRPGVSDRLEVLRPAVVANRGSYRMTR